MAETNTINLVTEPKLNIKTYNNQAWYIKFVLINSAINKEIELNTECINSFSIYNSLDCFSPTIKVIYNDFGFILSKYIRNTGLLLSVHIEALQSGITEAERNNPPVIQQIFILNDIKIVSKNVNTVVYELNGELNNKIVLTKNCNYATNKETGKISPYKIITDILQSVNYPFDNSYADTSQTIDFITSQNMTIADSIKYCLELGVSKEDPPTYFVHALIDNTARLINQKKMLDYNPANELSIYDGENGITNPGMATIATDIIGESPFGGIQNLQNLSTFEFNNYDHNKRRWSKYIYSSNLMKKTLANLFDSQDIIEDVFTPDSLINFSKLKQSYPNYTYNKMYDTLKQLELGTNILQFFSLGNLTRDAGQLVILNTDNTKLFSTFFGSWLIYQVVHKWEDKTYTNDITCYRTMNMKPILNSEK